MGVPYFIYLKPLLLNIWDFPSSPIINKTAKINLLWETLWLISSNGNCSTNNIVNFKAFHVHCPLFCKVVTTWICISSI